MNKLFKTLGIASLVLSLESSALALPKEKVLTVSAKDYAVSQGKTLADYTMVGVSDCKNILANGGYITDPNISAPDGTEVIVDYRISTAAAGSSLSNILCYSGTALIPKSKKNHKKEKSKDESNSGSLF